LVAGSTWSPDETILIPYINQTQNLKSKFIIAPHNIHLADIEKLKAGIHKNVVLYSQINIQNAFETQVLIIDSIGLLSAAYAYAQVAYVGGGFGSGIHNVLEPATYGIPILIGPKYQKFKEAVDLISLGGCIEIKNEFDLTQTLDLLAQNQNITKTKGQVSKLYVMNNMGASEKILAYIQDVL
jgi:3-deoxy-D-manno-octulosonic-acid transferase